MFVITPEALEKRGRIKFPADKSFRSARYLTANEAMGFSYNENNVAAGTDLTVWLKHHWEANYIISGQGEVTDLTDGKSWPLEPGVLYVVGPNDRHRLHFTEDECHLSIFHPPLKGDERFDQDGSYEASGPVPQTDRRMFTRHLDEMRAAGGETVSHEGQLRIIPLLTREDDVGFSLSALHLAAGSDVEQSSGSRRQAFHIIAGHGELTDLSSGQTWQLKPSVAFYTSSSDHYGIRTTDALHIIKISAP